MLRTSSILLSIFLIASCASSGPEAPPEVTTNAVVYTAEKGLTSKQRFSKALKHLEYGNEGKALAELNAFLVSVPDSSSATNIVEQINTASAQYFPAENFLVVLESGESLSTLAKKYLGSALKFYALAKYNDIDNPSRVNIGQSIKIPLTPQAKKVLYKEEQMANESELDLADEIIPEAEDVANANIVVNELDENGDIIDMALIESELLAPEIVPQTPATLTEDIIRLSAQNEFEQAVEKVVALKDFGSFDKQTSELAITALLGHAEQIAESDPLLASSRFAEAAELQKTSLNNMSAFANLKRANELAPEDQELQAELTTLQREITDKYHREASSAFRRQELDKAISLWDKVLSVDPNHLNATLYRDQAMELKSRLKKISN
ncbi:MAG: tetratricopeptide (TPR) repeat protein [Paraglaciecola sp.]|jgi:tetratricopeptide (TPR) repeat protein